MVAGSNPVAGAMKKMAPFLLKQYSRMSGEKKMRIAMQLSKAVREMRAAGKRARGV
ncbi:hypothetical protein MUP56_01310 [Patescibacteria group bacterium]|nr:hypothetical protein [Patescibacteria group bacterium]